MAFRKEILTLLVTIFSIGPGYAQADLASHLHSCKFAAGFSCGHYGYDPGVGIEFTSPSFFRNRFRARVRGNQQWLEAYKASYNDWIPYNSYSVALAYHSELTDRARFYIELGVFAIQPDKRFSHKKFHNGLYEFNGLEVFLLSTSHFSLAFYLGFGPAFIEAYAEKVERKPRYGNGMHYSNGLRFYF